MRKDVIQILLFISLLPNLGGFVVLEQPHDLDFDLSVYSNPLRMEDLDGPAIVKLSQKKVHSSLIYPAEESPFDWMDHGKVDLVSYEEYIDNPELFEKEEVDPVKKIFPVLEKFEPLAKTIPPREELPELPPISISPPTPLPPRKSLALPGDQELIAFMDRANRYQKLVPEAPHPLPGYRNLPVPPPLPEAQLVTGAEGQLFSDPMLLAEYQRRVNASTLGRIDSKLKQSGKSVPLPFTQEELANLKLKASKRSADGKILPAQASEFYLTTQDLRELLKDMEVANVLEGEVKSVAEIWAHAEKNLSTEPEIALSVKSILLQAKVGRTRTNPFGEASLNDLRPDETYFLIGIDKDENTNVVTIWSKKVEVNPGENEVELSSNDVIYQD